MTEPDLEGMNKSGEAWAPQDKPMTARLVDDCFAGGFRGGKNPYLDGSAPHKIFEIGKLQAELLRALKRMEGERGD
ncbi:MAG: hypothetical protein P1U50_00870 [Parvibaculaceae bacterium]|nr:hypothetical protein [Parvibaculaceae bacterium]